MWFALCHTVFLHAEGSNLAPQFVGLQPCLCLPEWGSASQPCSFATLPIELWLSCFEQANFTAHHAACLCENADCRLSSTLSDPGSRSSSLRQHCLRLRAPTLSMVTTSFFEFVNLVAAHSTYGLPIKDLLRGCEAAERSRRVHLNKLLLRQRILTENIERCIARSR